MARRNYAVPKITLPLWREEDRNKYVADVALLKLEIEKSGASEKALMIRLGAAYENL